MVGEGSGSREENNRTAFGENLVASITPKVRLEFPYNINSELVDTSTTGSGSVTHSGQFTIVDTTAATSSSATLTSKQLLKYDPGIGGLMRFTALFTTGVAGSVQIVGVGDTNDGFFFGYNGTEFGVLRRSGGTDNWTPQSEWSHDRCNAEGPLPILDQTKGNVFQIRYQWLGFGAISFYIEHPTTGGFQLVHRIEYANANLTQSVENPSLPLCIFAENTTNDTAITIKSGSMSAFIEGIDKPVGLLHSASNAKAAVTTTETNILTVRNKATYQSITNRVPIRIGNISAAVDGSKPAIIRVTKDATLGGSPSYSDISTNTSVVEVDTAGTTVTGGVEVLAFSLSKAGSELLDMFLNDYQLSPGESLTISCEASSTTTDCVASLNFTELF